MKKKFFAFLTAAVILVSSAVTFAAPSDHYDGHGHGCHHGECWR